MPEVVVPQLMCSNRVVQRQQWLSRSCDMIWWIRRVIDFLTLRAAFTRILIICTSDVYYRIMFGNSWMVFLCERSRPRRVLCPLVPCPIFATLVTRARIFQVSRLRCVRTMLSMYVNLHIVQYVLSTNADSNMLAAQYLLFTGFAEPCYFHRQLTQLGLRRPTYRRVYLSMKSPHARSWARV